MHHIAIISKFTDQIDDVWVWDLPGEGFSGSPLETFRMNNKVLDQINKDLEKYLDTKRAAFPRFYFLSPDELIQILSDTRNPNAVQPHLKKCFDNMNKIIFTEEEDSREIIGMISTQPEADPETIYF